MSLTSTERELSKSGELSPELAAEIEKHSALPSLTKDAAVQYAREQGIPVFRNAIHTSVNSGELPSFLISGQALIAPRDLIMWILCKRRPNGPKRQSA